MKHGTAWHSACPVLEFGVAHGICMVALWNMVLDLKADTSGPKATDFVIICNYITCSIVDRGTTLKQSDALTWPLLVLQYLREPSDPFI